MVTRTSPRLAAQKLALSPLNLGKENPAESSKPTAGGSISQKVNSVNIHLLTAIPEITVAGLDSELCDSGAFSSLTFPMWCRSVRS